MANKKNIDEKITRLVQSIEFDIPASIEEKLTETAETLRPYHRIKTKRLPLSLGILTLSLIHISEPTRPY